MSGGLQNGLSGAAGPQSRPVNGLGFAFRHELQSLVQEGRKLRAEGVAGIDAEESHLSLEAAVKNSAPLELKKLIPDGVDIDVQVAGDLTREGLPVRTEEEQDSLFSRGFKQGLKHLRLPSNNGMDHMNNAVDHMIAGDGPVCQPPGDGDGMPSN